MHKLDDFHELYKEVTARLLQYIRDPSSGLQPHELDWFEQLVGDFIAQYEMWSPRHPQPTIEAYLLKFDKWLMPREIRLAGHAFLHIAYDLPRVMSAKLSASVKDRTRQGQIFVQAGPLFSKTFLDWIAAGKLGRIRKLFPQDAMRIMVEDFGHPAHLPRAGDPNEIGPVIAFVASRRNSYMTGANINVDGGSDFS